MRLAAPHCALSVFLFAACGDRSPPALWPEPPPPTLAKPIGIDEPVHSATDTCESATTASTAGDDATGDDATAVCAPTSADNPAAKEGEPPLTVDPWPRGRPPMPPLVP